MKLTEKINNLFEKNIRYTVFKLAMNNDLKDREELNNLGELNKYLSKVSGNYIVVATKENGKSQAKFIGMKKGERSGGESPINKNQNAPIFKRLKDMDFELTEATIYPNKSLAKIQLKQAKELQKKHRDFDKDSVSFGKFRELQMLGSHLADIIDALEEYIATGSTNVEMESKFIDGTFRDLEKFGIK